MRGREPSSARPVRVMHVIGRLSPGGGVQVVVRRLAAHLDPAEVELHVQSIRPLYEHDRLETVNAELSGLGYTRAGYRPIDRLRIVAAIAKRVREVDPDVVQLHSGTSWFGFGARLVARRPAYLIEVHDAPGSGRHGRGSDAFEGWWVRRLGAAAVCHSASVSDEIRQRWHPPEGRLTTFPLAVDLDVFRPDDTQPAPGAAGALTIAAVGRFVPSKRFDLAVRVIARLVEHGVDARLLLVGSGNDEESIRALAAELGVTDRVEMCGPRFDDDLAATIRSADVLISTSSYEGFGLTAAEASACGRPVVAMIAGGIVDIVEVGVTGYLVGGDDVDGLVGRLEELAADPARRAEMGRAGADRAAALYSGRRLAESFRDLYRRLAGRDAATAPTPTTGALHAG